MSKWSTWRSFPDPNRGEYLYAPFGPGVYELRRKDADALILCGQSRNVAYRMIFSCRLPLGAAQERMTRSAAMCVTT